MGFVTKDIFGNKLGRGRWYYVVPAQISTCPCGQVIPWGHRSCKGHGKWIKRPTNLVCSTCDKPITLRKVKQKDGTIISTRPLVHYINGKMVCHSCKCKQWNSEHKEYVKIYRILNRDRRNNSAYPSFD